MKTFEEHYRKMHGFMVMLKNYDILEEIQVTDKCGMFRALEDVKIIVYFRFETSEYNIKKGQILRFHFLKGPNCHRHLQWLEVTDDIINEDKTTPARGNYGGTGSGAIPTPLPKLAKKIILDVPDEDMEYFRKQIRQAFMQLNIKRKR